MIKLFGRAVFYKLVIHAEADHMRRVAVIGHPFQNGRTQTSGDHTVLGGDDGLEALAHSKLTDRPSD